MTDCVTTVMWIELLSHGNSSMIGMIIKVVINLSSYMILYNLMILWEKFFVDLMDF